MDGRHGQVDLITQKLKNLELVSAAISAVRVKNEYLAEFKRLKENDFEKELFEKVLSNNKRRTNHAEAVKNMDRILKEMQIISLCPELHSKGIGAIGGGFSSGKSSFINSFLDTSASNGVRLAEGINPVTVIPSYVICDSVSKVEGVSFRDGRFEITNDMYNSLSHDNIKKSFDFDLMRIVFYTTVHTPMQKSCFGNLCLIDTPGYNPPGSGNTKHDFENAQNYIKNAKFLIWLVGLDVNGTFPKSDIDFLHELDMFGMKEEYPLYIVANKAGGKPIEQVDDILDNFVDVLDDYDISYEGISAYDSKEKKMYSSRGKKDLFEFLMEHNKPSERYRDLKDILYGVFKEYIKETNEEQEEHRTSRQKIRKIMLDALESGNMSIDDDASAGMEEGLNELLSNFKTDDEFKKSLVMLATTRDKFMACLRNFCESMGIVCKDVTYCQECGRPFDGGGDLCQECAGKTCLDCGKRWPSGNVFCSDCGRRL